MVFTAMLEPPAAKQAVWVDHVPQVGNDLLILKNIATSAVQHILQYRQGYLWHIQVGTALARPDRATLRLASRK
jgi:hypothetical protein